MVVKFNAGNPLDVNDLNQLSTDINTSIKAATATLQNSINEQGQIVKKFAIVSCGTAEITAMSENTFGQATVTIQESSFTKSPIVTVTVAEDIKSEDIDVFVQPQNANSFVIKAKSTSKTRKTLNVNWIAAQMQIQS